MINIMVTAPLLLLLVGSALGQHPSVRVQVIDRGQADGVLIRTPNDEWIVIDAGTNRQQAEAMRDDWGVDTVALATVSHRHFDHLGGMDEVFDLLPVKRFLGNMDDCSGNVSDDSVRAAVNREPGVTIQPLGGDSVDIDGVRFIVLPQPPAHEWPP